MSSMPCIQTVVVGGIDTHKDLHTVAVVGLDGRVLAVKAFSTTRAGYRALIRWLHSFGRVERVGVEQTGSYGAGVLRALVLAGIPVLEVNDASGAGERRGHGKDDGLDAIAAARAALEGRKTSPPRDRDGEVEALRVLRTTRATAVKARRAALQQLRNTIIAAPDEVRDGLRELTRMQLIRTLAGSRPDRDGFRDPVVATRLALRALGRRIIQLNDEIAQLEELITTLVGELGAALIAAPGIGSETAGQFLVTAGDNPERLRSEAGFAKLCGVAPLPASSGQTQRHRLNRGGDRQANRALHLVVISRLRVCPRTRAYADRRRAEGLSKREIIRCLKRYVAREVYQLLTAPQPVTPLLPHKTTRSAAR